jgi:hypothetical protein
MEAAIPRNCWRINTMENRRVPGTDPVFYPSVSSG